MTRFNDRIDTPPAWAGDAQALVEARTENADALMYGPVALLDAMEVAFNSAAEVLAEEFEDAAGMTLQGIYLDEEYAYDLPFQLHERVGKIYFPLTETDPEKADRLDIAAMTVRQTAVCFGRFVEAGGGWGFNVRTTGFAAGYGKLQDPEFMDRLAGRV